jgi:hypothetical protein
MRKKLEGNGLWESSRMMLPEHKDRINRESKQKVQQNKPELMEDELQEMFERLKIAKSNTLKVTVTVFGQYGNRRITGTVTGLDPRLHLIKIQMLGDWELIDFSNVLEVELDAAEY